MGLIDLKLAGVRIPLYDIAAISAGFYAGYCEGKGMPAENFYKYGPTGGALVLEPLALMIAARLGRFSANTIDRGLRDSNITLDNGRSIADLPSNERKIIESKLAVRSAELRHSANNIPYISKTLKVSARTGIETAIGYFAGRMYSQMS